MIALAYTEASEMQGRTKEVAMSMDWRLELVPIPVSDVGTARGPQARPRTNRDGRRRPRGRRPIPEPAP